MIDPIVVQSRLAHVGDIRTGTRSDKGYPTKLDTFRITTPHEKIATEISELYGGTPTPWDDGYELITTVSSLPVIVPPQQFDPWLETWSKGGLQKRCTGTTEYDTNYPPKKLGPCPNTNESTRDCSFGCKPATRLSVLLPDTSIVGTFTIRSTGWNAYSEISSAMALLHGPHQNGVYATATLELRQEERRHNGQTNKYGVVTLRPHITTSIRELMNTPQPLHPSGRPILPQDQPPLPDDPQILEPPAQRAETPPPPGGESSADVSALLPDTADTPPALPDDTTEEGTVSTDPTPSSASSDTGRIVALAQLHNHTTTPPTDKDTKPIIETWIRTAFQHAHNAQLPKWQTHDGPDALHLALQKLGYDHLGELRKPQLLEFAERTHTALTDTIGNEQ